MPIILTPNMSLPVPVVGQELGPQYATDINNCMTQLDAHNHTPGYGVQIPPSGININSDLTFLNNRATNLKSAQFFVQGSPLAGAAPDLGAVYVSGPDLYYNDTNGNQVRITQNGNVNAGGGSISGLVSPASASYSSGTATFIWQSNVNTSASMDNGPITIRDNTANAKGITIQSPVSLPNDYSLTLPSALPASTKIVTIDNSGNVAVTEDLPNSQISSLGTSQLFTTSGTFTVPAGINYLRLVGCGGGGGGGGGRNAGGGGGGGGGAPVFEVTVNVIPADILTITIGSGGTGGTNGTSGATGNVGQSTTITGTGVNVTFLGGQGGQGGVTGIGGAAIYGSHNGSDASSTTNGTSYLTSPLSITTGNGGVQFLNFGGGGGGSIGDGALGGGGFPPNNAPPGGGGGAGLVSGVNGVGGTGGDGQVTIYIQ